MLIARARTASLAATLAFGLLAACSDGGTDPTPTPTPPDPIAEQIDALWPAGAMRDQAQTLLDALRAAAQANNTAAAETTAFALTTLTLSEWRAGHLQGGAAQLPTLLDTFLTDLFAVAKLPAPVLSAGSFGPDGLVAVVDGSGGIFVTATQFAGLVVPAGALTRSVLLVVDRLPDSTQYAPHQGPLPTTLDQYPLFYHFATTPTVTFSSDVTVGLCQVTDSLSAYYIPDALFPQIRLAHPNPSAPTTLELLDRVDTPFLDCTDVSAAAVAATVDAALLAATRPGIGGRVRKFSPFGAVDPGAPVIGLSPSSVTFTAPAGGANPTAQTVAVSNTGTGTLNGLAAGPITYGTGATGWLTATLDQTTAPATLTLAPTLGSLSTGSYTATVPITAAGVSNSPQVVTVTFTVVGLTSITLSPPTAGVFAGANQQFSVTGQLSDGSVVTPAVTYSATGGTITAGGLYTAGAITGAFQVVATEQGGTLADTSTVQISYASNAWTTLAPMQVPREDPGVGAVNGIIYVMGGFTGTGFTGSMEAYDPATNTWTSRAAMPTPRAGLGVGVVNGVLYAVGGFDESGRLGTVEAYDPVTDSWAARAPIARRGLLGVGVAGGVLYAVGGNDDFGLSDLLEAYDPVTNTWSINPNYLPTGRDGLAVAVTNGLLYAIGGYYGGFLSTVEAFDPMANSWSTKSSMPTARRYLGSGVVNGRIYAVGGQGSSLQSLAVVEEYDPVTNVWSQRAPMPTARADLGVAVVNGLLYAVGGLNGPSRLTILEVYQP